MMLPEHRLCAGSAGAERPAPSETRTVFRTEWFRIEQELFDDVPTLDGKPFYRLSAPDGVVVLALTEASEVILIKQFRPAIRQFTLEFPSGFVDHGETPSQAAERELLEETGYRCQRFVSLGQVREMMNRSNALTWAFFGDQAVKAADTAPERGMKLIRARPAELREWIRQGTFEQSAGLALVLLAEAKLGWPSADPC